MENIGELEAGELNLCKILQGAGYRTGFLGKSHVIRHDWLEGHYEAEEGPLEFYPQDSDPRDPEVAERLKKDLAEALKQFENRPFGEFTE